MTMEKLNIAVHVTKRSAVLRGTDKFGYLDYPALNVLPLLSQEAKEWLVSSDKNPMRYPRYVNSTGHSTDYVTIDGELSDASVAAAIMAAFAADKTKLEEEKAKALVLIAKHSPESFLSESSNENTIQNMTKCSYAVAHRVIQRVGGVPCLRVPYEVELGSFEKMAEFKALKETAEQLLNNRLQYYWTAVDAAIAIIAEEDAVEEAKKKEREALAVERALALREYAAEEPRLPSNVQRAAKEGFEVENEVRSIVRDNFLKAIGRRVHDLGGSVANDYFDEPMERVNVPSEAAYAIKDAIANSIADIATECLLPGIEITVGKFYRRDVNPHHPAWWRTTVLVTAHHPWLLTPINVYVLTEPIVQDDDDDDDE